MLKQIFSTWISIYSIGLMFLPMTLVRNWINRKSSDGFSAVNLLMGTTTNLLWLKHAYLTSNYTIIRMNSFILLMTIAYISVFAYYQSNKTTITKQLVAIIVGIISVFTIADYCLDAETAIHFMGSLSSLFQSSRILATIYEIKRTISLGTTEYLPATLQFAFFFMFFQMIIFGIVQENWYMVVANIVSLISSIATISLYFFYPPLTWTVPIFNIAPKQTKKE